MKNYGNKIFCSQSYDFKLKSFLFSIVSCEIHSLVVQRSVVTVQRSVVSVQRTAISVQGCTLIKFWHILHSRGIILITYII